MFISLYENKGYSQHVSGPTYFSGSTLDLVLTLKSAIDLVPVDNLAIICDTGTTSVIRSLLH